MDFANIKPPQLYKVHKVHQPNKTDRSQKLQSYPPCSAWLDLDALNHNIEVVNRKMGDVSLRLATKSIRSVDVLNYIKERSPNYIGLMSYAADESVYLLENGFDNILCAYPTVDMASVAQTIEYTQQGAVMTWMIDCIEQAALLHDVAQAYDTDIHVCIDINMSMPLPKLYFGTKRSPVISKKQLKKLIKQLKALPRIKVTSVMGYEAQIAGLPERLPSKKALAPIIRMLKKQSQKQVSQRRKSVVSWMTKQGYELTLVNGGGSGSIDFTSHQSEVTEVTVGSAYYKPAYFDYMDSMEEFLPAAGFVLPVTRQPEKNVITCHGGGFIASGSTGIDKSPVVHFPTNLSILADEGFGEVQTPMKIEKEDKAEGSRVPQIGDSVWCRHAKAGELCEHFNRLICYQDDAVLMQEEDANNPVTMMTYRGEGKCFH